MPRGAKPTGQLTADQAKDKFLEGIAKGQTNAEALVKTGRSSDKTIEYWRKTDPAFKARMDAARAASTGRETDREKLRQMGFAEFSEKYLGHTPSWHHLQWIDMLEGRPPRDLHPSQTFEPASAQRLLVNTPPHHGKSQTITMNYVVYRICMDPKVRVKLVSKSATRAYEFLHTIKTYLTDPDYLQLQKDFGPEEGFKETASSWRQDQIYLERQSREKDPTIQALGVGSALYGARSNLIILDDVVDTENAHEWEKQMRWINRIVKSRLGKTGKLLVVGTRIASIDLYRELRNGDHYAEGKSTFTYLSQPAVLEYADDPKDWKTLWPVSNAPIEEGSDEEEANEDGTWTAWDGPSLATVKSDNTASDWALVYMQADVDEDKTFPEHAVKGSVNGQRRAGPLRAGAVGHPERGSDGLHVIGSMDPSGSGDTAFVVGAVDRDTKKRYILNATSISPWSWPKVTEIVQSWTDEYGVREWVVEKNMYHSTFRQNEALATWLQSRGVRTTEHYTGAKKQDIDLGVASLAPLFGDWHKPVGRWEARIAPLIELPSLYKGEGISRLVEQLVTWAPDTKNKTDFVMALWFFDLRARELCRSSGLNSKSHMENKYATRGRLAQRKVIRLSDFRASA